MTEKNSLSLNLLNQKKTKSEVFRSLLISNGYKRFNGTENKGTRCYDSLCKEFFHNGKYSYSIFCYCYNLRGVVDNPDLFEFGIESQIETELGIVGLESVQWDFLSEQKILTNIIGFEALVNMNWKNLGEKPFPIK